MREVLFLTGTRADFGKLKPLIRAVEQSKDFRYYLFVTGIHVLSRYGYTYEEILKAGFTNIHTFLNHVHGERMDAILANTIMGLSRWVHENPPDLLVVHGDRVETLAGAIVGALNNIRVAHIEGGEVSGTVDELIRHATSKMSHAHFVANESAAAVLRQMGERDDSIFVIGSPDVDVMVSDSLPELDEVRRRYGIGFGDYAIAIFHPVTTEADSMQAQAQEFVSALLESKDNYVVIFPNNDEGSEGIFTAYERLRDNPRFRVFPSLRFEYFLALLKSCAYIVGNSSAGVREAPVYAIPTVNVGTRQNNRFNGPSIVNVPSQSAQIVAAMRKVRAMTRPVASMNFGSGGSAARFMEALASERLWSLPKQKQFSALPGLA